MNVITRYVRLYGRMADAMRRKHGRTWLRAAEWVRWHAVLASRGILPPASARQMRKVVGAQRRRAIPVEDAFLSAIVAEPGERLHQLAYADWLDEQGREEEAAIMREVDGLSLTIYEGHFRWAPRVGSIVRRGAALTRIVNAINRFKSMRLTT